MNKPKKPSRSFRTPFLKTVAFVSLLFGLSVVLLLLFFGRYDDRDFEDYQKLVESKDATGVTTAYTSRQQRLEVQKDVYFFEAGERLQLRLQSKRAELALDRHDEQTEIVEQMNEVTCYMQEELFYQLPDGRKATKQTDGRLLIKHADPTDSASWIAYDEQTVKPMQIVRFIEADIAFYYYKNDQFLAENVKLTRYVALGHTIDLAVVPIQPMMSGIASWVEFSLGGEGINFKAYHLKAKLYAEGGRKRPDLLCDHLTFDSRTRHSLKVH